MLCEDKGRTSGLKGGGGGDARRRVAVGAPVVIEVVHAYLLGDRRVTWQMSATPVGSRIYRGLKAVGATQVSAQ